MGQGAVLNIAVVGSGQIGSTFAFQLARTGGHEVTVVARPGSARLRQLQGDDGIVNVRGERAEVRVCDRLDALAAYDVVIVTVLAHQVDAVIPALQGSAAKAILFMFNQFEPERLRGLLGADRCVFGMPFVQARLDGAGKLDASIGAGGQKSLLGQQRWVEVFQAAGLPAKLEPDMMHWLRCHAPMCVAFESVSVAGVRRGGGASWREAMVLARGVHACFALIRASGKPVYPATKAWLHASPSWVVALVLWAMSRIRSFRELLAGGEEESRALAEVMAGAAQRNGQAGLAAAILAMQPSGA